jgi:SAM-dependent methyltransferase
MKTYSILRRQEDAVLGALVLSGRVLDLGGHRQSSYFKNMQTEQPIEIANFDAHNPGTHKEPSGADHIFDFEKPFPLKDATYNAVLCVNVLEHIYNYQNVIRESHRILTRGGEFHITVPFFFNIHGSPNDYFRYTKSALERMLSDAGFVSISVHELGYGPCSAVFQNFGGSLPTHRLKIIAMHTAVFVDRILSKLIPRYRKLLKRVPLGYAVRALKSL